MDKDYPLVTKESLVSGILTLFAAGAISEEVALRQIKQFATDDRVDWAAIPLPTKEE